MRVMIRFTKGDPLRFVSHLEMMRTARLLFRRAELPVAYSEGFHPHPILSFAMALSVGVTSEAEYMDLGLKGQMDPAEIMEKLNAACPSGMAVTGVWEMQENAPSQMAMVTAALWKLEFSDMSPDQLTEAVDRLNASSSVEVEKNNGKKKSIIDIRPGIREMSAVPGTSSVTALLDAGSRNNIQPGNLADALMGCPSLGHVKICRLLLLGEDGKPLEEGAHILHG